MSYNSWTFFSSLSVTTSNKRKIAGTVTRTTNHAWCKRNTDTQNSGPYYGGAAYLPMRVVWWTTKRRGPMTMRKLLSNSWKQEWHFFAHQNVVLHLWYAIDIMRMCTVAPEETWKCRAHVRREYFVILFVHLVVLVSAFVMVSTVWLVSCLLFFYSRWPPCPAVRKSGETCHRFGATACASVHPFSAT